MASFELYPLSRFERTGPTSIRRPKHFLQFSFDEQHKIHVFSDESLRYYYPPFIAVPGAPGSPFNLSKGFEHWVKGDDSIDNHLDGLLEALQAQEESLLADGSTQLEDVKIKGDIITWRGMMTKIMTAAFDIFSDFEMNATWYQGSIYVEENHAYKLAEEDQNKNRQPRPGEMPQQLMQYWGYKFENVSVLKKPWSGCSREEIESRDDQIVNSNTQYCSIVRTGIGSSSLILAGEVDCIMGERPSNAEDPIPWLELKTSAEPPNDHPRERQKFERKMLRFWAQSFLLGVPKIIVGYRTWDGYLTRIEQLETQKIPGMVSRGEGTWNGNMCINMTAAFLEFLKKTLVGQDGVWRIKRSKNSKEIAVFRVEATGTGQILRPAFKEHREKILAAEIAQKLGGGKATGHNAM